MSEVKGHFFYQDEHTVSQVSGVERYFEKLLINEKFNTIIEIGTQYGGLTYIISDIIKNNNLDSNLYTLDFVHYDWVEKESKIRNFNYINLDERSDEFLNTVIGLIENGGKTLVLCDGGNKIEEFNRYSKFLKQNDFIMAHDYSKNEDFFQKEINGKIWNWLEIQLSNISESVNSQNLVEYHKVDFWEVVWCCFEKN
jgi:cephalosporin hydroxylase